MNEQFTVIRAFKDKYSNQNYSIGQTYNAEDQDRARELEGGGYIAPSNSVAAKDAMAEREMGKAEAQKLAQAHLQAAANAEPKTVVNGKVVPLKVAQSAEAAFNASEESAQTGIRQHHDNTTEAVQAGQVAKNTTQAETNAAQAYSSALQSLQAQGGMQSQGQGQQQLNAQQMQAFNEMQAQGAVRPADVQSAQQHLEQHISQAQQDLQQMQQAEERAMNQQQQGQAQQSSQQQQQAQTNAAAMAGLKTNPMAAAHEEAAEAATAAEEVKSKAARTAATKKQGQ